MGKKHTNEELYNWLLFYLWEVSTQGFPSGPQTYKGARRYARFLLSEINRTRDLVASGETAVVSRGLAIANSLINAWAYNMLHSCFLARIPPPRELCEVFYLQLSCTHLDETEKRGRKTKKRAQANNLFDGSQGMSLREIARQIGVNPTTVMKWKKWHEKMHERPRPKRQGPDVERLRKLARLTRVVDFYPPGHDPSVWGSPIDVENLI